MLLLFAATDSCIRIASIKQKYINFGGTELGLRTALSEAGAIVPGLKYYP